LPQVWGNRRARAGATHQYEAASGLDDVLLPAGLDLSMGAANRAQPTPITHLGPGKRDGFCGVMFNKFEDLHSNVGNGMADYDRRWRPGCSSNYVDAHDEIWEAVQREPARFTAEMLGRSRHSRPDSWVWARIDCSCWVCEGPGPVVGELCYKQHASHYRWLPVCVDCLAWYRAGPPEEALDTLAEHAGR
jgi:hypothetical protein